MSAAQPLPVRKVLIVENLRSLVEKERNVLSRADFRIFVAADADAAMRVIREELVDLVILDLDMPGMDSIAFCAALRRDEATRRLSVIMVCFRGDLERCQGSGVNACLVKPLDAQELLHKAVELMSIPERRKLRILVRVAVRGKFRNAYFFCQSTNISASGILLETERMLERGDVINCSFFLDQRQILVDGEIVRVQGPSPARNYGVRFVNVVPETQAAIEEYIEHHRRR